MTDGRSDDLEFEAGAPDADMRLDHFLVSRCPGFSRSRIQKAIAAGRVRVDGRSQPGRHRITPGEVVCFRPLEAPPTSAAPENLPLDIVHRDDAILVVNKAAGMVTHPAPGNYTGTLVNALQYRFDALPGGDSLRAGIVHRLDKETSGLMVVALDEQAHAHLSAQLQDRRLGRIYKALSWGQWTQDEDTLTTQIARHPTQRRKMAVVESGGKQAVTRYAVIEDYGFAQYCRVELETGRTHQIRVHFSHFGHAVLGDPLYGDDRRIINLHPLDKPQARAALADVHRQMLHAEELHLEHPRSGEPMTFRAPLPEDFAAALSVLRNRDYDKRT